MRIDVAAQESALAQARLTLPPLRKQFEQTRDLILEDGVQSGIMWIATPPDFAACAYPDPFSNFVFGRIG